MTSLYTKNGKPLQVSGDQVWSRSGKYVGRISGGKIFDPNGRYAATIQGDRAVYRSSDSGNMGSASSAANRVGTAAGNVVGSAISGDEPDFD